MSNSRAVVCALSLLVITPVFAGCAATSTHESSGQYLDDAAITDKVKTKLLKDPKTSGLQVTVDTYKGQVQLSGYVNNEEAKDRAGELARGTPGVTGVTNDIKVK